MGRFSDFLLDFIAQFAGGRGGMENNLVRFGLAAAFWGILLVVAWWKRHEGFGRKDKLLMVGFGLGFLREILMFSVVSLEILDVVSFGSSHPFFPPLEHALSMAAVVLVAGGFMQYLLDGDLLVRRYIQIGLGAAAFCYLATFWWWARFIRANPSFRFGQTWCDWLFRLTAVVLIAAPIVFLSRRRGWIRAVVSLALFFFFLDEFLMLFNLASGDVYKAVYNPIRQCLHILAIPLLGHVYFLEQSARRKAAEGALRKSYGELRAIIEAIPDAFLVVDPHHKIVLANKIARDNAGGIDPVAAGLRCYEISHHRDGPCEAEHEPCPLAQVLDTKRPARVTHTHFQSEWTPRWIEIMASPILNESGEVVQVIEICRDITDLKDAHAQQELFADVLTALNEIVDSTAAVRKVLSLVKEFTGFEAAAIRLKKGEACPIAAAEGYPADFLEAGGCVCANGPAEKTSGAVGRGHALQRVFGDVLSGRTDASMPFFSEGGSFWVNSMTKFLASAAEDDDTREVRRRCARGGCESVALVPLRLENEIVGLLQLHDRRRGMLSAEKICFLEGLGISLGISFARRRVEREMQAILQLHETTLNNAPSFLIVLDADLNVLTINRPYLDELGVEISDVRGKHVVTVLGRPFLTENSLLGRISAVAENGGKDELWDVVWTSKGSSTKYYHVKICAIQSAERGKGRPCVLLLLDDVTERRNLEEQVREAAKLESIGQLAGGVAHDFNNLLTGIKGYASFTLDSLDPGSPARHNVRAISSIADRAADLTRQLLAFSRRQPLEMVVLDINEAVKSFMKMLGRLIGEDVELRFCPEKELRSVRADPGQIEQILLNLAVNARDAMLNGGCLTIETANVVIEQDQAEQSGEARPGPYVLIAVTDTGCGMDEETQKHIFEPFFTTKGMGKGTGLGLATVYGIVKQHGGVISVSSQPGEGTTFRVYLPSVEADAQALPREGKGDFAVGGTETILVVEDEESIRRIARRALESHGYTVFAAGSAQEAENLFASHGEKIQLLLTDVVLPDRNGPVLYQRLTLSQALLKVIYMSGYMDNAIFENARLSSDAPLLRKPFGPSDLLRKVRETLDGMAEGAPADSPNISASRGISEYAPPEG